MRINSPFPFSPNPPALRWSANFSDTSATPKFPDAVSEGALRLIVSEPTQTLGFPLGDSDFGSCSFAAVLALTEGADDDHYGIFARRAAGRYLSFTVSPIGVCAVRHFDGESFRTVAETELARGMTFAPGLHAANLFQVIACGSGVTFLLNHIPVLTCVVEPGMFAGEFGLLVGHGPTSGVAATACAWAQVRDLFA